MWGTINGWIPSLDLLFSGMLDGFILSVAWPLSLVVDWYAIYDVEKASNWYDTGFCWGLILFYNGVFAVYKKH